MMESPRRWADRASKWNEDAAPNPEVWDDSFNRVDRYMVRALLAYILLCICGLLRAACAKYLSLKFHHRNHFEHMQRALVQENVVQVLSQPNSITASKVVTSMGRSVELKGMDIAHWAALKFVSRIVDGDDQIFGQVDPNSPDKLQEVKDMCAQDGLPVAITPAPAHDCNVFQPNSQPQEAFSSAAVHMVDTAVMLTFC